MLTVLVAPVIGAIATAPLVPVVVEAAPPVVVVVVVAAVLVYRLLTYVAPIGFGVLTYVFYKRNRSWLDTAPALDPRFSLASG